MALKKTQLYSSLWQSCDELRGGMDASQYKDYVLTLLFVKYVSDKAARTSNALIQIPEGGSFADMVKIKGDKEIGDKMNKIIGRLAGANDLKGVIDQADFNDETKLGRGKDMQDRLSKLVAIFEGLDLRANRAEGDDLLGDAYEYLMRHFATESGKSKGQFYTPAEVSRVMAKVVGIGSDTGPGDTLYDPTCGSGSLLIRAAAEASRGITIYGQEMDVATWALARMNMILHGHPTAELWRGNTLAAPHFKERDGRLKTFDFAVANPPFSAKAWSHGLDPINDEFGRFEYGIPPPRNGDYAFLLHLIRSLKSTGKGAIILPHGVLFRGNREAVIRKNLIRRGLIKGVIGLPSNLFYGTGIPACILVIDKENAASRRGIFMIDASKGFVKDGNKNRLRSQDIHKIVDVFRRHVELPRYSRMVPASEIASPDNDYNLNIPRYIDSSEPEDLHDLDAHLNGGIPNRDLDALDAFWDVFPSLREALFEDSGREGYSASRVETRDVKATILAHAEFKAYAGRIAGVFEAWRKSHEPQLKALEVNDLPKVIIHTLSEDLLARFADLPLLSRYDVYQRLMDYWTETMQDDVYLIAADGWVEAARPRGIIKDKNKKIKETPDLVIKRKQYKMDLVPPGLIVARYFTKEQADIEALQAVEVTAAREREEFVEEHTGEDGLLEDATNDKGRVTKSSVKDRLKAIKNEAESDEERGALTRCLALIEAESEAGTVVKNNQAALDAKVLARYDKLTEAEIKSVVVEGKWFASTWSAIEGEVEQLTARLSERVQELEERYADPLPYLEQEVEAFSAKVVGHLNQMEVQRLLTGKTRLPGFTGEWEVVSLDDAASRITGFWGANASSDRTPHMVKVIRAGDISPLGALTGFAERYFSDAELSKAACQVNDIVITVSGNGLGKTWLVDAQPRLVASNFVRILRPKHGRAHGPFLAAALNGAEAQRLLNEHTATSAYPNLRPTFFSTRWLLLPPLNEQIAIATVLSNMDHMIALLGRRRDKVRGIKQGMMQELLTGRVRLVGRQAAREEATA